MLFHIDWEDVEKQIGHVQFNMEDNTKQCLDSFDE